jgi:hypothetical protein
MSSQERKKASQRSPFPWGPSKFHGHMDKNYDSPTQVLRKGGVPTHYSLAPPDARNGSHNNSKWTLAVVHVNTCRCTRWHVPHVDHLPRAHKVALSSNNVKSLSRMGNPDSLPRLCGFDVRDSHPPRRFSSPGVSCTSMASASTLYRTPPTNPQEHSSFPPSAIMQSSLLCVWLPWEIPFRSFSLSDPPGTYIIPLTTFASFQTPSASFLGCIVL